MNRKCLAVGIILLFIGVAVAPSINSSVVKTSDDLVEVTSQACGIQGFGNTTVKLTKEQYQNLEQYLVDFRARLNQTATREEAVPIFKDAVVELNKYGLLPKGMSVEQAQRLVTKENQNKNIIKHQKKLLHSHLLPLDKYNNYFCLVGGKIANGLTSSNMVLRIAIAFTLIVLVAYFIFHNTVPYGTLENIFNLWSHHIRRRPIHILDTIAVDNMYDQIGPLFSVGLLGIKYTPAATNFNIYGFSGIIISRDILTSDCYLFGTALCVVGPLP